MSNTNRAAKSSTLHPVARIEAARAAIADGAARGLKSAAMDRRWREFFAAEDALKVHAGGWA